MPPIIIAIIKRHASATTTNPAGITPVTTRITAIARIGTQQAIIIQRCPDPRIPPGPGPVDGCGPLTAQLALFVCSS